MGIKAEISALKVEISRLKVEKVEGKGGKGGNERRKAHSCNCADDPLLIHDDPLDDPEGDSARETKAETKKGPPPSLSPGEVEMVNALVSATGKDGHRFFGELREEAEALLEAGYGPGDVKAHYLRASPNGHWNWYQHDWRGRKGDFPRPKEIWETISGAVKWQVETAEHEGQIDLMAEIEALKNYGDTDERMV